MVCSRRKVATVAAIALVTIVRRRSVKLCESGGPLIAAEMLRRVALF